MTHGFSGRAICSSHRRCIVDRMIASIESSIVLENFMFTSRLPSDDYARSCDAVLRDWMNNEFWAMIGEGNVGMYQLYDDFKN